MRASHHIFDKYLEQINNRITVYAIPDLPSYRVGLGGGGGGTGPLHRCGWLPFLSRKGQVGYSNRHSFFEGDDANSTGVEGDDANSTGVEGDD